MQCGLSSRPVSVRFRRRADDSLQLVPEFSANVSFALKVRVVFRLIVVFGLIAETFRPHIVFVSVMDFVLDVAHASEFRGKSVIQAETQDSASVDVRQHTNALLLLDLDGPTGRWKD
jgi:hypothetical protein